MPTGTCAECGQEEVLGAAQDEGMPFLCCDCDSEMAAYNAIDRSDLKRASRTRMENLAAAKGQGNKRSSMIESARSALPSQKFDPEGDEGSAIKVLTDKEQNFFAGMGSSEIGPANAAMVQFLADLIGEGEKSSIVELGAGCGAAGIWIWKKRFDNIKVVLSDVPRLVPLLMLNCEQNMAIQKCTYKAVRWGLKGDVKELKDENGDFDYVISVDGCYNEDKSYPFFETVCEIAPSKAAVFAQCIHPEHEFEGRAAIEALQERCGEAGWTVKVGKEVDTDFSLPGKEGTYKVVILVATPPAKKDSNRRSRHSRFENADDVAAALNQAEAAGSSSSA